MKRFLSVCMMICVLLSVAIVPTFAAEAADPLAENLIVHYDFEGANIDEQLSDKATGGQSKENINGYNYTATDELTVSNGIAHIKSVTNPEGSANPYTSNGFAANFDKDAKTDVTKSGADFVQNTSGEYTFYIDFGVKGDGLTKGGFRDCFRVSVTNSNHLLRFYAGNCNTSTKTKDFVLVSSALTAQNAATLPYETAAFYQFAVTMKWNETSSKWDYKGYLSVDDGQTYLLVVEASAENAKDYMSAATMLTFGNKNVKGAVEYDFDDIRVYNKALTPEELVAINYAPEQETEAPTEEPTTPQEEATAAPENNTTAATEAKTETTGSDKTEEEAGCGAAVTGVFAIGLIALSAVTVLKKKK